MDWEFGTPGGTEAGPGAWAKGPRPLGQGARAPGPRGPGSWAKGPGPVGQGAWAKGISRPVGKVYHYELRVDIPV